MLQRQLDSSASFNVIDSNLILEIERIATSQLNLEWSPLMTPRRLNCFVTRSAIAAGRCKGCVLLGTKVDNNYLYSMQIVINAL